MANIYSGYYYLVKNNPDSSILYYEKALDFSVGLPLYRARVLRLMAAPYRKKTDYSKSLQLLNLSENEYLAINDPKGLATVYGEIAANYNAMLRPQDAIPFLTKALSLFEKAKNKKDQMPIKQSLANTYMNIGNYPFAIDLYEETLQGFKKAGMLKNYYLTLINYSECLINVGKVDMAKMSLLEAIAGLGQFSDKELIGSAYSTLGRLETQKRNFVQCEKYYEKAFYLLSSVNSGRAVPVADLYLRLLVYLKKMDRAQEVIALVDNSTFKNKANLQDLARYEKAKIEVYKKMGDHNMALASAKTTIELLDTLNSTQDKKAVITMQAGIQHEFQGKKNDTLKKINSKLKESVDSTENKKLLWIWLPLTLLAALMSCYLYKTVQHRKKLAENQSDIAELVAGQKAAQMLNKKMSAEIKEQEEQLKNIEEKTGSIEKYLNDFANLSPDINADTTELKSLIGDTDYGDRFRETFTSSNTGFIESLGKAYPQLSESDLYFCALLNLNLPYKDLSIILKVVPEAVRKRKYRIRKKMGITDEKDMEYVLTQHNKKLKH
ncbi:tetratricopeptide repeat protein [Flavobacterium album]|nr:tetratricopeptide repeat protein [Flavobacterium album]